MQYYINVWYILNNLFLISIFDFQTFNRKSAKDIDSTAKGQ